MAVAGLEVELIVSVIEACLILPTMLCVYRFPFYSDNFSRFALGLMLVPEFLQLLARVGFNVSNTFGPWTMAVLTQIRYLSSLCLILSILVQVICLYYGLPDLDFDGATAFKFLSTCVLWLNVSLQILCYYFTDKVDIRFFSVAAWLIFVENSGFSIWILYLLVKLYKKRADFVDPRRGPEAKIVFRNIVVFTEWELIVYFATFEYYVFDPNYADTEFVEVRPPAVWIPYPHGTLWAFLRLLRPTFCIIGIWLWHGSFRYDLRKALRQKGHKATNTITISGDFSGRNEPAPTVARESTSNNRLTPTTIQTPRRGGPPQVAKGPFAQIERQQQRLGTSYMNRR
ncbi:unnamed protein product, partial [Mesorhabditis belari]|uniref:Uncharacterized protein n=1 Tax=Mesorhabditis belari TaxID=2138241 RepID=A0AAF3FL51_9BILA